MDSIQILSLDYLLIIICKGETELVVLFFLLLISLSSLS